MNWKTLKRAVLVSAALLSLSPAYAGDGVVWQQLVISAPFSASVQTVEPAGSGSWKVWQIAPARGEAFWLLSDTQRVGWRQPGDEGEIDQWAIRALAGQVELDSALSRTGIRQASDLPAAGQTRELSWEQSYAYHTQQLTLRLRGLGEQRWAYRIEAGAIRETSPQTAPAVSQEDCPGPRYSTEQVEQLAREGKPLPRACQIDWIELDTSADRAARLAELPPAGTLLWQGEFDLRVATEWPADMPRDNWRDRFGQPHSLSKLIEEYRLGVK